MTNPETPGMNVIHTLTDHDLSIAGWNCLQTLIQCKDRNDTDGYDESLAMYDEIRTEYNRRHE